MEFAEGNSLLPLNILFLFYDGRGIIPPSLTFPQYFLPPKRSLTWATPTQAVAASEAAAGVSFEWRKLAYFIALLKTMSLLWKRLG